MITLIIIAVAALCLGIINKELSEGNEMSAISIMTALVQGGMTPVAACAMAGNMQAESALVSINLEDRYERLSGYTDESYTLAVDTGSYSRARFISDKAGYGLYQLTLDKRKANFYDFAKASGKSIGDEGLQVAFCLKEFQIDFPGLWKYLQTTTDIETATSRICKEFENPAIPNISVRTKFAKQLYADYGPLLEKTQQNPEPKKEVPSDTEPPAYTIGWVKPKEHTPEAAFLMAHLNKLGYDVLWDGLEACIKDFQQKRGLDVDGIVGTDTWKELLK